MKKLFFAVAAFFAVATAQAQSNTVTKELTVSSFTALDLDGVMNVYITMGDKEGVKIEADEKVVDKITAETNGSTLFVKMKKGNYGSIKKMNIYITCTKLEEIRSRLVGNLKTENTIKQNSLRFKSSAVGNASLALDVKDLQLDLSAVGNNSFSGKAENCKLNNSSVGNVRAAELVVENMDLQSSAIGNLEYNAKNTVSVKSTGIGKVINKAKKQSV
jgi:hypothetical protein